MAAAEEPQEELQSYPLQVHYCGVCTMPLEYCEYGGELKKCREWLQANLPEVYEEVMGVWLAQSSLGRVLPLGEGVYLVNRPWEGQLCCGGREGRQGILCTVHASGNYAETACVTMCML